MEELNVHVLPESYEIKKYGHHTEINSFGPMKTFIAEPNNEYHVTVLNFEPNNSHLQIGFCDEKFEVRLPINYNIKKACGTVSFGAGDDTKGHSASYDPIGNVFWQHGISTEAKEFKLKKGDLFVCKHNKNKMTVSAGQYNVELPTMTFDNCRPCFSVSGNITIKVCKNKSQTSDVTVVEQVNLTF